MQIPEYVATRIRRDPPEGCGVVAGSTPVISFGDSFTAKVATLGLNPSRHEFTTPEGGMLSGRSRRFATLESSGASSLSKASDEQVAKVIADCADYFHGNPYLRWFKPMEQLIGNALGASYFDGTACHIDLVQWVTDPVWGKITGPGVRERLLRDDRGFLIQQLNSESFGAVLINGRGVQSQLERALSIRFHWKADALAPGKKSGIATASAFGTHFVAWTINLQSSFGVTRELRAAIAARVGEEAGAWM
ncbi:MAG: hypothetical protein IT192_07095 [Microbacteriaceae bacterium]|nr:hypothetical protein [Microbacteriaceae bacterium]